MGAYDERILLLSTCFLDNIKARDNLDHCCVVADSCAGNCRCICTDSLGISLVVYPHTSGSDSDLTWDFAGRNICIGPPKKGSLKAMNAHEIRARGRLGTKNWGQITRLRCGLHPLDETRNWGQEVGGQRVHAGMETGQVGGRPVKR